MNERAPFGLLLAVAALAASFGAASRSPSRATLRQPSTARSADRRKSSRHRPRSRGRRGRPRGSRALSTRTSSPTRRRVTPPAFRWPWPARCRQLAGAAPDDPPRPEPRAVDSDRQGGRPGWKRTPTRRGPDSSGTAAASRACRRRAPASRRAGAASPPRRLRQADGRPLRGRPQHRARCRAGGARGRQGAPAALHGRVGAGSPRGA